MNRILLFCALGALWGCRAVTEPTAEAITLSYSTSEGSKTDALTAGDEVAVFARLDGTETYFLEAEKFITGSDGKTLNATPAIYYPEPKQAVQFYAYFPYHTGTFSVPSDQSTAAALKKADLCWATASSTPIDMPVQLAFQHVLAQLKVSITGQIVEGIALSNVFVGGILDTKTGTFSNSTQSDIFTTGEELILPAQTLTRLILTVSGVEYVFDDSVVLEAGKTITVSLVLSDLSRTASLAGSSISEWKDSEQSGIPQEAVSNLLTLHWPKAPANISLTDRVEFTIKDEITGTVAPFTVSSGITFTDGSLVVPLYASNLHYPYIVSNIVAYDGTIKIIRASQFLGSVVYKRGPYSIGCKPGPVVNPPLPDQYVKIGSLNWAVGNLVAKNTRECMVGKPTDHGTLFKFGSLIGWKGGSTGDGTGICTKKDDEFWVGRSYSWSDDAMVWPEDMVGTPNEWFKTMAENINTLNEYFFNYSVAPWNLRDETMDVGLFEESVLGDNGSGTLRDGRYAVLGVGDPCTYYLGEPWRTPTLADFRSLFGTALPSPTWAQLTGWVKSTTGISRSTAPTLTLPATATRHNNGYWWYPDRIWGLMTATPQTALSINVVTWNNEQLSLPGWLGRPSGLGVRCVSSL